MASKCLVTFQDRNTVVNFTGEWRKENVFINLQNTGVLAGHDVASLSLQVYDEDFEMFVDITDDFVIPHKAKLKIKEAGEFRIAEVLDVEVVQETVQPIPARTVYTLPKPPLTLKMSIEKHDAGKHFKSRNQVVQWLFHDLCSYTLYPGKLYEVAASALVNAYPNLKDSTGTGHDSWREALRFRAKYERKKMRQDAGEVAPVAPKRPRLPDSPQATMQRVARPVLAIDISEAEDQESEEAHISAMQKELKKSRPDYTYIKDSLLRTFTKRRAWISKDIPSVKEIVERYPALALSHMVHSEFHAQTGVDLQEKLQDVLASRSTKIIEVAKKKRHLENFFASFDEAVSVSQPPHEDLKLTASICALPSLVKERVEAFTTHYVPDLTHHVPTITFEDCSPLQATTFRVQLEAISIDECSLISALSTQIALYWAFDIVFYQKAQRTFDLICRLVGISSGVRPTPLVRVAHTMLQ